MTGTHYVLIVPWATTYLIGITISRKLEADIKKNIENASIFVVFSHNYPIGTPYEVM